ncbi:hypothetical protein XTPLMG728_2161 [Xanthomonas translucens pv. poae]|uniref:Uncharacterized protein n=1 Tax=Xanthomonas graminis pv. poae TaxID=227946 RepID=A0A0K2ZYH0_9XANT|nr:hypothetical protein XTPLMG728_2161 [Xanthomonas translucens pv. poae]
MATNDRETQLLRDAYAAGISNPQELANFMAQVGYESGGDCIGSKKAFAIPRAAGRSRTTSVPHCAKDPKPWKARAWTHSMAVRSDWAN